MFNLLSVRGRAAMLTGILTLIFLLFSPLHGNAQISIPEQNQSATIDPLFFDFTGRTKPSQTALGLSSNYTVIDRKKNVSPSFGELDPSLNAAIDSSPGNIQSSALQPDGKIIVGGYFKTLNGTSYKTIVRLNGDNSIDPTFNASTNGTVMAMALQTDGKIVIGGAFTVVNGTVQNRIARLNPDGSLDASFNTGFGADNLVYDIAVQTDGKIVLGGSFVFVGTSLSYYVARLNPNGSLDTSFVSPIQPSSFSAPPSIVYSIALQTDGKIILGGLILTNSNTVPPTTTPVTRLNSDGSFDSSFNPGSINSNLYDVAVQTDGKILIGGFFTQINGASRKYLARLNPDGSLDNTFDASSEATAPVWTIRLKPDGKILFSSIIIIPSSGVAKQLNSNGSLDRIYSPPETVSGQIYTILSTASDKIFAGGSFRSVSGGNLDTALLFNPNGAPDPAFSLHSTALGGIRAIIIQTDGKIIVGGNFNRVNGVGKSRLARLNPDGTIDAAFNTSTLSATQISVLALQPDGKILVGGTNLNANNSSNILFRLNSDGTLDSSFVPGIQAGRATAAALARQPDGKILISYIGTSAFGSNSGLVRLNIDGSLDSAFTSLPLQFEALAVLPDGKILAGGPTYIGYINSGTNESDFYYGVLRLNADGGHDRTFRAGLVTEGARFTKVYALALQPDGRILVGGSLFTGAATMPRGVLRLDASGTIDATFEQNTISSSSEPARIEDLYLLPNGKVLAGGFFDNLGSSPQRNLARLNSNGLVDESFHAETDNTVFDIDLQDAGKLLIGGDFEKVNNISRTSLARLINQLFTVRHAPYDFDGDNKTDIGIFRPSNGQWWINRSSTGQTNALQFGAGSDKPVPADFSGDGKTDLAVYRPSTNEWFILRSEDNSFYSFPFGAAGDVPLVGDFDGDGKSDPTIFRPSTREWFISKSSGGTLIVTFGLSGDQPVLADYDGDGRTDFAIYRPSLGQWWISRSSNGSVYAFQFGTSTDKPVQGDYTGDGKADTAIFRPSTGEWFILRSEDNSFYSVPFGISTDLPTPGDYDGDGKYDTAVFRPSENNWYINRSTAGILIATFGISGDKPLPNVFVP